MRVNKVFRGMARLAMVTVPLLLAGCDECWDDSCCGGFGGDNDAPAVPVGVTSVTGDGEVYLEWIEVQDHDLEGYRIYVSDSFDGRYESIGETYRNHFVDHGAVNGRTYYYAVTAFDHCDNESDLSYEVVHDTPRPEGFDLTLMAAQVKPTEAGYDFSAYRRQAPDAIGTDIYFQNGSGGVAWMYAASGVGIQDVGYLKLDDLDWAPDAGWSDQGRVELIEGHTYAVLTADDHYAKFNVVSLSSDRVVIDWAYQIDRGNRELSVGGPVTSVSSATGSSARTGTAPAAQLGGE